MRVIYNDDGVDILTLGLTEIYGYLWFSVHRELRIRLALRSGSKMALNELYDAIFQVYDYQIRVSDIFTSFDKHAHQFKTIEAFVFELSSRQRLYCSCGELCDFPTLSSALLCDSICAGVTAKDEKMDECFEIYEMDEDMYDPCEPYYDTPSCVAHCAGVY
jgi:hypothetical protein